MYQRVKVFISSTFEEFAVHRKCICAKLTEHNYDPWMPEREGARSGSNENRCRQRIAAADIMLCLIGFRYGSVHPAAKGGESIVEWEYSTAKALQSTAGKPSDILVYVPLSVRDALAHADSSLDERQKVFLVHLTDFSAGDAYACFATEEELADLVVQDLTAWSQAYALLYLERMSQAKEQRRRARLVQRTGLAVAAVAVAVYLGSVRRVWDDPVSLLSLSLIAGCTILAAMVLGWQTMNLGETE